ncbi:LytTR family transcriptional regulator DNA-binding domain-containing protein [Brevundimonas sp.]|uniref:LytTR family DNA-binding domain-containing protein n=2 Tax=Brevundimonas sp. TaxID=1871086 RepID=UPI002FC63618
MMRERDAAPHKATAPLRSSLFRRAGIDLGILVAIGLLMGFLGPFGSDRAPAGLRYIYWMICMVGGGLIALAGDYMLGRYIRKTWIRVLVGSVILTPLVALLVRYAEYVVMGGQLDWHRFSNLLLQVWPILLAVLVVQALIWRRPAVRIETRTLVAPPLPQAEADFRKRLSAKRRSATLFAIQAYDHYLKVHTDAGEEMITLRMSDAMADLELAHGWRVHRSWWVAASAIESATWNRSSGELMLKNGMTLPVSKTYRHALKEAGWL